MNQAIELNQKTNANNNNNNNNNNTNTNTNTNISNKNPEIEKNILPLKDTALQAIVDCISDDPVDTDLINSIRTINAGNDNGNYFLGLLELPESSITPFLTVNTQPMRNMDIEFLLLNGRNLWKTCALSNCHSTYNIYLNLDLLTIDPHSQDYSDFKIKAEQVEVQRDELTRKALFVARDGLIAFIPKKSLPSFNQTLRQLNLSSALTMIGKTWGNTQIGTAQLDIYRDAKTQLSVSATELLGLIR
jgi:hypothetical protein